MKSKSSSLFQDPATGDMRSGFVRFSVPLALLVSLATWSQAAAIGGDLSAMLPKRKVPQNVILVKGAWSSENDSASAVPEGGSISNNVFRDQYFGITYPLPPDWIEKYTGPPPSDSGSYVLAQISRPDTYKGDARGNILITAQDLFFTPLPATNALEFIDYAKNHLQADYKVEPERMETKIFGHAFASFAYWSPAAELHWYVLATEIRCHMVEFVFMNRDPKTLDRTVMQMSRMKLPNEASPTRGTGGSGVPMCIKDYARGANLIERVGPVFSEQRFNPIPVRIIIDKQGNVKHIHFLSAFPDETKAISDALSQWKFRPYLREGQPVEVETGIMFGPTRHTVAPPSAVAH
jgi:hypothetical protein